MTITKFTTTYHVSVTLPSDDYADAGAAVLYAKAHGLWVRLETETEFDCTAEEADALWDELAPGQRFRVLMLMTVEEAEQAEADRAAERHARALARAASEREARERDEARANVRAALVPSAEVVEALAEFAAMMGRVSTSAEHFTCTEAETVARLLRALGHSADAERFLDAHAAGDDEDHDQHRDRATAPARG